MDNPNIYVNMVRINASKFDFVLELFQRIPNSDLQEESVNILTEKLGNVTMSPQHFKALAVVIQNQLKAYEEKFGEIKVEFEDIEENEG